MPPWNKKREKVIFNPNKLFYKKIMTEKHIDIKAFLDQDEKKDLLRLLTAGSVDDGKSTLIGRLLFDSKRLYEDQISALERDSKKVGHAGDDIDYALLLDGLKAEREQGITIDVAYRYFSTNKRKFIIADTPGHEQYTRNMITGGSTANLAVLLVDARKGVITQTKRHTYLVSLLGIQHIVVAINKMDLVGYQESVFEDIKQQYLGFVKGLDVNHIEFIPISALKGDNVVDSSTNMPWYKGESFLHFLENVEITHDYNFESFRFPIQYVNRPSLDFRGFSSNVASGIVSVGDEVMALPSKKVSKVKEIYGTDGKQSTAFPPQAVTITLEDEIDLSRGDMLVHNIPQQPFIGRHFKAMIVWMDEKPLNTNTHFYIKHTSQVTKVNFEEIAYKVDINTLEKSQTNSFELNEIGLATLTTMKPLIFDRYKTNKQVGAFVIIDPITHNTSAVGMILGASDDMLVSTQLTDDEIEQINQNQPLIAIEERINKMHQKGCCINLVSQTPDIAKKMAYHLEKELFKRGATTVILDKGMVPEAVFENLSETFAKYGIIALSYQMKEAMSYQHVITIDVDKKQSISEILNNLSENKIFPV